MPVERLEFHLKPWNFFTQNPTLDLPPTRNAASRELLDDGAPSSCCSTSAGAAASAAPAHPASKL
jgi:primary-amine oxidase